MGLFVVLGAPVLLAVVVVAFKILTGRVRAAMESEREELLNRPQTLSPYSSEEERELQKRIEQVEGAS